MNKKFKHKHKKIKNNNMATLEQVITQLNSLEMRVLKEWAASQQRDKDFQARINTVLEDLQARSNVIKTEVSKETEERIKVLEDARQRQRNLNGDNQRKVEEIRKDLDEVMVNLYGTGKHDGGKPKEEPKRFVFKWPWQR